MPFAGVPGPALPGLTPLFVAGVLTTELPTCFLLFSWANDSRSWSVLLLGTAWLFSSCSLVSYLLTFPGALLLPSPILGTEQSASWVFVIWTDGFSALTLTAIVRQALRPADKIPSAWRKRSNRIAMLAVCAVWLVYSAVVIVFADQLPLVVIDGRYTLVGQCIRFSGLAMMVIGVAIIILRLRNDHEVFQWLAVSLVALACANILIVIGGARFTLGWSAARFSWMASALALFIFFMRRFVRRLDVLMDARQALEQAVQQRTADLQNTVRQRDLLLREVYHRVKNNLQVVDSLIAMEGRRLTGAEGRDALTDLRSRVFALGLVHRQLMSSSDLETFSLATFLQELCDNLASSLAIAEQGITVQVDVVPLMINLDFAIPVGLLTTELLSNAVKHARPHAVSVSFRRADQRMAVLSVEDDGQEAGEGRRRLLDGISTGSRIIKGLTRQLEGRMDIEDHNGMRVSIFMPLPEAA